MAPTVVYSVSTKLWNHILKGRDFMDKLISDECPEFAKGFSEEDWKIRSKQYRHEIRKFDRENYKEGDTERTLVEALGIPDSESDIVPIDTGELYRGTFPMVFEYDRLYSKGDDDTLAIL